MGYVWEVWELPLEQVLGINWQTCLNRRLSVHPVFFDLVQKSVVLYKLYLNCSAPQLIQADYDSLYVTIGYVLWKALETI
ncbi:hypothetical protein Q2T41_08950 [Maribacter confluentis]|uniref:Uncharacterized protein n=1 Tax=Maribacter confluentis TaxID=1656093 RepID=A0ABT8RPI4_9FLAO|nr:hypothetical protein [Maribacter confluentis]MDO1512781.1 hypothetical protein [Maribacter confluentis]